VVTRGLLAGSLPQTISLIHNIPILVFFSSAGLLLRRRLKKQEFPPPIYLAFHLSGGWLFGLGWATRLAAK